jgi:FkbM family methyltransferase
MRRQPWFWPIKLLLKRLSGRELWLRRDIKVDTIESGGWRFLNSELDANSIVYSLGVGDSIEFDLALIRETGATLYAFDPTPFATEWVNKQSLPKEFIFYPWAASGKDGHLRLFRRVSRRGKRAQVMWTADQDAGDPEDFVDAPAYTFASLMKRLEHSYVDLMKMDVEGAEYDILDVLEQAPSLPRQLLVEYHHRFPGIGKARTAMSIKRLRALGYRIFDVSETGREIGFLLTND